MDRDEWRKIAEEFGWRIEWREWDHTSGAAAVRAMAEEIADLRASRIHWQTGFNDANEERIKWRAYSEKLREALDKSCACEFIQECKNGKWGDVKMTVLNICPACEALALPSPGEE